ncbi:MAG: PKD domain-containing protein [Crocinitomicaceae bacterium]
MKKLLLLVAGVVVYSSAFGQTKQSNALVQGAQEIPVQFMGVTGNLIDYVEPHGTVNEITKTLKTGYHPKDDWILNEAVNPNALPQGEDPALQKVYPPPATDKALNYNWDAISNFSVSPADPTVDVGPNHVVHMTNGPSGAYIQVYDKTGTAIGGQVYFDNFMGMAGGLGDPIVLYDERADRWMLSEFSASGNNMHVAISQTADPTGAYYTFVFNAPNFPDYPKYSIWEDAYIITTNESGNSPIYALNRADLLSGTATTAQRFTVPSYGTIGFQAATPVSLNGTTLPPANTPPMVMRMRDDAWAGVPDDALEIWDVNIDWANSGNSSVTQNITLGMGAVPAFDSELCGYTSFSCIDQPSSNTNLDPLREVLMNRIHYRNFGSHESIVCCHVTDVDGNDQAGIRWYELRRTGGAAGSWTIYQEGTYAPDTDSRWMPSIGISATGNIGLAYNVSSASTFPSLRYTGRRECDPLNQMTEPETTIAAGTSPNGSNRYGDYNAMGLDPSDGETFYFVGIYNPNTGGRARIAAFDIPVCAQFPEVAFDISSVDVEESSANVANGCLDYIDVDIPMSIGVAPSQNADITVTVTGGTATQGVDFDLLGSTFTLAGATLTGTAQIRVYNDNYVEGTETINLGYTLNANGGDAYSGATNQTVLVNILDDDLDPASMINTVTVFSHDFESGLAPFTTVNNAGGAANDPWAVGDAAAASSANFTVPNTNATQMAWINDDGCNCTQDDVDLTSPTIDLTGYTGATLSFASYYENNVYQGDQEVASILVSTGGGPFNLVQLVPAGSWSTVTVDLTPYVGNNDVQIKFNYSDGTGWLYGWSIDDVVVTGDGPILVQTAINTGSGMTANLGPNETVHFYDPATSRVMMTLENTSAWDYGCVTVDVDRDGTGASEFNQANIADHLHDKTFTVTPTNNNPTGSYNVTVYYEEAEVAGWEAATGNSRNNAEIIKVAGNNAINDVTPANAGTFTIENSPATLGAFNSDVTFTSSFSTGFSGFGVGIYNAGNNPPVANFSTTDVCVGSVTTFADASTNTPTSWSWDFGDGSGTSTAQNPSYTYATPGNYTVSLTATNAFGSDTYTQSVTVNGLPSVTASATSSSICEGETTTINATGASTYAWDNGAGTNASTNVSPAVTTTYNVTGTDANGCVNTDAVTITVSAAPASPVITPNGTVNICQGETTTLTSSYASGNTWSTTETTQAITVNSTGTYDVYYTDGNGCNSNITSVAVMVNSLPIVSTNPDLDICDGFNATLTATGASTYAWDNGAGTGATVVVSPVTTTTYTVTGTDANGCVNSDQITVTVNTLPAVAASADVAICDGSTTTLSATGASTYAWDNGAGTGTSVAVSPTSNTTYTVTGTDANGCVNSDVVTVTVNPNPTIAATAPTSPSVCGATDGSITVGGTGTGDVSWSGTSSGTANGVSLPYTVSGLAAGSYTFTFTDANGCISNIVNESISDPGAPAAPTVTPAGTVSICPGASATLTSSYAAGNTWSTAETTQSISVNTAGTYTVYHTDGSGCVSGTTTISVVVNPTPTVATSGDVTICAGETTSLTATGATTYTWDNGAGSGQTVAVSPTTTTTYTVTGVDANGCQATDQVTVTVTPGPTVTTSADMDICEGTSVTLTALGATSYSWDNGAGTGSSVTVSPTGTTTYTVTGTDANGCTGTAQVTVTVSPLPTVNITPAVIDTVCLNGADPITLVGSPAGGTFSGPGVSGTTFTPGTAGVGSHTITYSYTDGNGCTGQNTVVAVVEDCSGVSENMLDGVVLSPNPNDGNFNITGLDANTDYSIVDSRGRIVLQGRVQNAGDEIRVSNIESGAYYLYGVANGKQGTLKFIVTN